MQACQDVLPVGTALYLSYNILGHSKSLLSPLQYHLWKDIVQNAKELMRLEKLSLQPRGPQTGNEQLAAARTAYLRARPPLQMVDSELLGEVREKNVLVQVYSKDLSFYQVDIGGRLLDSGAVTTGYNFQTAENLFHSSIVAMLLEEHRKNRANVLLESTMNKSDNSEKKQKKGSQKRL
jgi:hypothetical protein